jgi:SAM-dependent methyltransferase
MRPEVKMLRKNVYQFITHSIFSADLLPPVLEIGPMQKQWTPVKKYFVDTRDFFQQKGIPYMACDHDQASGAEIRSSVLDLPRNLAPHSLGSIIALEVIEHVSRIWELSSVFAELLKPGGWLFLSTPYYFFRHAPFPDYWRISEDGLRLLFGDRFDIQIAPLCAKDERKPIHYTLVGRKKG